MQGSSSSADPKKIRRQEDSLAKEIGLGSGTKFASGAWLAIGKYQPKARNDSRGLFSTMLRTVLPRRPALPIAITSAGVRDAMEVSRDMT
jgi:hypothetical protein